LVPDGGTLQIGIGSLGDAVTQALVLRHSKNEEFQRLVGRLGAAGETGRFDAGLYACTEMLVEGLLDLHRAGILRREVDGAVLHAGFFVGSRAFYQALRGLPPDVAAKFRMTAISFVNELFHGEEAKRAARVKARFLNDAMMATLLGDIVSDGLEDGRVISGVGGQYNFVAQAFALEGARSVMILRASRTSGGKAQSNIRWNYGHVTIPRHLRDIVVTEYGVADLRGKSDRDVIAAMLNVTDSRWQGELLHRAKEAGKIERGYEIPDEARDNTPDAIARKLKPAQDSGLLPLFPFGSDFTEVERKLLPALQTLKLASKRELLEFVLRGMWSGPADTDCLERMDLAKPRGVQDRLYAMLLRGALRQPQT
jgi:acyl-CoA hydrolase